MLSTAFHAGTFCKIKPLKNKYKLIKEIKAAMKVL
jgi:hypothetical protein